MVNKHFSPTLEHWYAFKHDGLASDNPPTLPIHCKISTCVPSGEGASQLALNCILGQTFLLIPTFMNKLKLPAFQPTALAFFRANSEETNMGTVSV